MRTAGWLGAGAAGILLAAAFQERPCVHPSRGGTAAVSLEAVARAQEEVKKKLRLAAEEAAAVSIDKPYDSGLPACRARGPRRLRIRVPAEFAGKTFAFAPAGRMPRADFRVATSAGSLAEVEAEALAEPALAERLGVRCWPTLVRVMSEDELELVENP